MEENKKLLKKHCAYKRRHSCEGCRNHTKCVIFCFYLIAKRLVFLAKRNALYFFQKSPRGYVHKKAKFLKYFFITLSISVFVIIASLIFPFLKMKSVEAISIASTEDPFVFKAKAEELSPVLAPVPTNDSSLKNSSSTVEVVTNVAEFVNQEAATEMEYTKPLSREEKLESVITLFDIPLDYNVNLAFKGMDYLIDVQNFTPQGAAGVMGNFYAECRFDSSLIDGYYKGLAQWDADVRWPMISEWLYNNGYDLASFSGQLEAIFYSNDANEFTSGIPYRTFDKMREAIDPEDAAMVWLYEYERAPGQAESLRKDTAKLTYDLYMSVI